MLIGCVIDNKIDQNAYATLVACVGEFNEVAQGAVFGIDVVVVGYIVAAIAPGRGLEGHQPEGSDAYALQIIEPSHQALEVSDSIAVPRP